jgi:hypothetical protein
VNASTRLEAFIRAELARRRPAELIQSLATRTHRHQTQEGGRPGQPAGSATGGPGLADTGREERAAASMKLAAVPRIARR